MGGDEFCVVATVAEGDEAALAEIAAAALAERGDGLTIECAYGIAVMPDDTSAPNVALSLADQRMYEHKAASRVAEPDFVATHAGVPLPRRGAAPQRAA
jgi:GGDEF domain-containing protein